MKMSFVVLVVKLVVDTVDKEKIMNVDNMIKLADFLDNIDSDRFNIADWVSEIEAYDNEVEYRFGNILDQNICQTAGCIAGWAVCLMNGGQVVVVDEDSGGFYNNPNAMLLADVRINAGEWLGLNLGEADQLFVPNFYSVWHKYASDYGLEQDKGMNFYSNIHPKYAADMLRRIATGEVSFL